MAYIQYRDNYAVITKTSGSTEYIAEAPAGSSSADDVWRCRRITKVTAGGVTTSTLEWADGDTNFNNIADNLLTLSYS